MSQRVVIDTNVYVSQFIRPNSVAGRAVIKAWEEATTLVSTATWTELCIVLKRPKFGRYIGAGLLTPFVNHVWSVAEQVAIRSPIHACRDPRDDKFLEVAVHGRADAIVTGDSDLLDLNPFGGIAVLTPAEYLERK
jgi:putative PIN family toxin of toxin-antitoxin system